jgi:hypothetical protein
MKAGRRGDADWAQALVYLHHDPPDLETVQRFWCLRAIMRINAR